MFLTRELVKQKWNEQKGNPSKNQKHPCSVEDYYFWGFFSPFEQRFLRTSVVVDEMLC